jgi:hypothetical protein
MLAVEGNRHTFESVIIVFITLQNQSAPSQMTNTFDIVRLYACTRVFRSLSAYACGIHRYIPACVCLRKIILYIHIYIQDEDDKKAIVPHGALYVCVCVCVCM